MGHLAESSSLLLLWHRRRCSIIQRGGPCFVALVVEAWPLHDQTERERESAWRWSLGSQKNLWCGPSFSLGWDKPGSVAPLRLVGCLIETPAPSWAYFYSIFSLSFFLLPCSDLSSSLFFSSPLLPSLSISLPLSSSSMVLRCVSACVHDRGKWKKNPTRLGFWFGSQYSLAFFLFCLAVFILRRHLPRWQELPVAGLAESMQYIYSKCFNPNAQKLFICINNWGIVHQKTVQFLMFVSVNLGFNLNM